MIKQIFSSMGFSVIGRLAQFIGFVYASNCLLEEFGESSTALGWAQYIHFILTLGMVVVAVRYLADSSKTADDLIPSLFTGRLVLFGVTALIGVLVCLVGSPAGVPWGCPSVELSSNYEDQGALACILSGAPAQNAR